MHTVQLADGAGDYTFHVDDLTPHDGGVSARVKSVYDTHGHAFLVHQDAAGFFVARHAGDPPVSVRIENAPEGQRLLATFAADDDDVAGHGACAEAVLTSTLADDGGARGPTSTGRATTAVAFAAAGAYVLVWQLAAASQPARHALSLTTRCRGCV